MKQFVTAIMLCLMISFSVSALAWDRRGKEITQDDVDNQWGLVDKFCNNRAYGQPRHLCPDAKRRYDSMYDQLVESRTRKLEQKLQRLEQLERKAGQHKQ